MNRFIAYTTVVGFFGFLWFLEDFDAFWGAVYAGCAFVICKTLAPAIINRITNTNIDIRDSKDVTLNDVANQQ